MKNPMEVLRTKEQELARVKKEVDALRVTLRLLGEESSSRDEQKGEMSVVEMP
ncbi:MAG TPA: hypothetical protein VMT28_15450 [Terriglobales bacterium]|jgi:hypothetical protein|nr:hypothetical protein [Terriglobales bacterium]